MSETLRMHKKILITSTDVMFWLFLLPHARNLIENGYEVVGEAIALSLSPAKIIWIK